MTSMRLAGAAAGAKSAPPVPKLERFVNCVIPPLVSVFRQMTISCVPFVKPVASDVAPVAAVTVFGVPPLTTTVNRVPPPVETLGTSTEALTQGEEEHDRPPAKAVGKATGVVLQISQNR